MAPSFPDMASYYPGRCSGKSVHYLHGRRRREYKLGRENESVLAFKSIRRQSLRRQKIVMKTAMLAIFLSDEGERPKLNGTHLCAG